MRSPERMGTDHAAPPSGRGVPFYARNWDFEVRKVGSVFRSFADSNGSLRAAARKPRNLSKVNLIRQEPNESPGSLLREVNGSL